MSTLRKPQRLGNRPSNQRKSSNGNGATRPKPPLPRQHQQKPGIESRMEPRPRYEAPDYRPAGKLLDKVALITGGDSGIGRSVATLYAREGADVAIVFLPEEISDAQETRESIESVGRQCLLIEGDLSERSTCESAVRLTVEKFGKLDILVSNAAHQNRVPSIDKVTDEEFDRTFRTNIYAYFWLCRAALAVMKPGSAIIATSSETGLEGSKSLLAYSATKGAINAFTKALAKELAEKKIRVNAVAPGPVWTPLNVADEGTSPEKVSAFGKDTLFGRPAQPEEIAPAYVYLASNADSGFTTGMVMEQMGATTAG